MTLQEMLEQIKAENPNGLRVGNEEEGYQQLSDEESEAIFVSWAQARLDRLNSETQATEVKTKRQDLLDKLGITEEEAKLLLS